MKWPGLGNFIWSSMQTILSYQLFLQGNMLFIFLYAFTALKTAHFVIGFGLPTMTPTLLALSGGLVAWLN